MADKKKFPNPEFFRAKTEMDWKAQAANLKVWLHRSRSHQGDGLEGLWQETEGAFP